MTHASLDLAIVIAAPREVVFRYLCDEARFGAWVGGRVALDARAGGDLRIEFPGGSVAKGKIVELTSPARMVCTWGYDPPVHGMGPGSTRLEFDLWEEGAGTRLTLRHVLLPDEEAARAHEPGWLAMMSQLSARASREHLVTVLEPALIGYFAAWNEPDDAKRGALLATCATEDIAFADEFAHVTGREALSAHIANALRHMPGLTLRAGGQAQTCHEWVRFGWEVAAPDGTVAFRGTNFGRASADGRLAQVVGFWDAAAG